MDKIFYANGTVENIEPKNGSDYSLEELRSIVGGDIEVIFGDGEIMVLNEEGKLDGLPFNDNATEWFHENFGPYDFIVGDVLLCAEGRVK